VARDDPVSEPLPDFVRRLDKVVRLRKVLLQSMTKTLPNPRVRNATHGQTRSCTSQSVLRTIDDDGPISRAEIAAGSATGPVAG
jgi:hypothetical protein